VDYTLCVNINTYGIYGNRCVLSASEDGVGVGSFFSERRGAADCGLLVLLVE
jgi:hypothetical protein